jgi:hypothetical protein
MTLPIVQSGKTRPRVRPALTGRQIESEIVQVQCPTRRLARGDTPQLGPLTHQLQLAVGQLIRQ